MKQRISALMLAVTPTFKYVMSLLLAGTGLEYFLFHRAMKAAIEEMTIVSEYGTQIPAFEKVLESAKLEYMLCAVFSLFCALFLFTGCEQKGGKLRYTMRRLSVPEREIHLLWAVYYTLCFVLLIAWQAAVLFWFHSMYAASPMGEGLGANSFFLTTYRSDLLHSLLPLHDIMRQIRNAALVPALGLGCSFFSFHLSRGRRSYAPLLLIGVTLFTFIHPMANATMDALWLIYIVWLSVITQNKVWRDDHAE